MAKRWCSCCGKPFEPRPQVPRQAYCTQPACQRFRKRLWQKAKRKSDADYLANQSAANRAWAKRKPEYSRQYRKAHPEYTAANRLQQRARNKRVRPDHPSMSPALLGVPELVSGLYELRAIAAPGVAKMVVCRVELRVISRLVEDV